MDITILATKMIELFLMMFLGYIIFKLKVIDDHFVKKFSRLILDVTMPAMILSSVLNLTERQALGDVLTAFAVSSILFFILLPVIGLMLAKLFRVKKNQVGLYTYMNTYSNVGFMGFPVIAAIAGAVGTFYTAIFNLIFNLSIFSLGVWLMNKDQNNKSKFDPKLLCTPGIIVAALSIVVYFLNIKPPAMICDTVEAVGSITSPSAMLIIGCTLAKMDVKSIFGDWRLYPWAIIKQLIIPLLLWIPFTLVIKNELLLIITYILSAMPVANSAVLFANTYGGDHELAARAIFISTLISLITVPLCVMIVL